MKGPKTNFDKFEVKPSGCWEWTGSRMPSGYGQLTYRGRKMLAHRARWERERGPIPAGLHACHHCDNPCCVNLDHLFLGTARDNLADMRAKGRDAAPPRNDLRGIKHPGSKLTLEHVEFIRTANWEGKSLAAHFGVSVATISRVRNNLRYRQ